MENAKVIRNEDGTVAFVEIGTPPQGTNFRVTSETWEGNVRTIHSFDIIK